MLAGIQIICLDSRSVGWNAESLRDDERVKTEMEENICRRRQNILQKLAEQPSEEALWECIVLHQNIWMRTASGLPFRYQLKIGRNGAYTKELWIDRRKESKSLAWSSIALAFRFAMEQTQEMKARNETEDSGMITASKENGRWLAARPKSLGDIRGVSYIYPLFYRFGLIAVPEKAAVKMNASADPENEREA